MSSILCVDLDHTLIVTDSLWESVIILLKRRPYLIFSFPFFLLKGKGYFKSRLVAFAPDARQLLYREDVLAWLKEKKIQGYELILTTGSHWRFANTVAVHLGIFSSVLASDDGVNLVGEKKLAAIRASLKNKPFEYIGNGREDVPVWREARVAHLVSKDTRWFDELPPCVARGRVFHPSKRNWKTWKRTLRLEQWTKNILIFSPLLLSHQILNVALWQKSFLAFISFSICASSVYILNDLLDLHTDREHTWKSRRPFASGELPLPLGFGLVFALLALGLFISIIYLPQIFSIGLLGYVALTGLYTFRLKKILLLDVLVLAFFYVFRVFAGSFATGIQISPWFLAFAAFFFLGLAFMKRFTEIPPPPENKAWPLVAMKKADANLLASRGYEKADANLLGIFGVSAGFLSILVMILYINSSDVILLYPRPYALWLVAPCLLYWTARLWILANRGRIEDDPLSFALRDPESYFVGGIITAISLIAALPL